MSKFVSLESLSLSIYIYIYIIFIDDMIIKGVFWKNFLGTVYFLYFFPL